MLPNTLKQSLTTNVPRLAPNVSTTVPRATQRVKQLAELLIHVGHRIPQESIPLPSAPWLLQLLGELQLPMLLTLPLSTLASDLLRQPLVGVIQAMQRPLSLALEGRMGLRWCSSASPRGLRLCCDGIVLSTKSIDLNGSIVPRTDSQISDSLPSPPPLTIMILAFSLIHILLA